MDKLKAIDDNAKIHGDYDRGNRFSFDKASLRAVFDRKIAVSVVDLSPAGLLPAPAVTIVSPFAFRFKPLQLFSSFDTIAVAVMFLPDRIAYQTVLRTQNTVTKNRYPFSLFG